jgi:tRNA(Ile)-lysidine synthase
MREGRIIRPLLHEARAEILEFLDPEGLRYMTDSSNLHPLFLRNRIRHELMPVLAQKYNPGIVEALGHTAEIIRKEDDYLRIVIRQILSQWRIIPGMVEIRLPLPALLGLHEALQGRVIKCLLEAAVTPGYGIAYHHVEAVQAFARKPRSRRAHLDLPGMIRVEKDGDLLKIGRVSSRPVRRDKGKQARP